MYKNQLYEILQKHKDDNIFYTDASKSEEGVGIAIISKNLTSIFKLPECCSILHSGSHSNPEDCWTHNWPWEYPQKQFNTLRFSEHTPKSKKRTQQT